jgi:hypothetical protein
VQSWLQGKQEEFR